MIKYATQIRGEIALIESKTYQLQGHDIAINFKFELVPSDMKWLATFSGELTNSATYPSSFANVKQDDVKNVHGTFARDSTCTWKPWLYDQRVKEVLNWLISTSKQLLLTSHLNSREIWSPNSLQVNILGKNLNLS